MSMLVTTCIAFPPSRFFISSLLITLLSRRLLQILVDFSSLLILSQSNLNFQGRDQAIVVHCVFLSVYWMSPLIMDKSTNIEDLESLKEDASLKKSVSNTHLDILRPTSQYFQVFKGQIKDVTGHGKAKYSLIKDVEDYQAGIYDKPLPCFGCGLGWFSFLLGFVCPVMWFYAAFLYLGSYYRKDPRERAGLAASAIAALGCSVVILVILLCRVF
ncbi:uncharacterized protein LOC141592548 isoform X2 [Silene latifolia]|uniref:uncharacterized protein LOC141592548 isoform X2 n=2 Tax=Silene latifolia TaxID=37657 RepID=UPI003D771006